MDSYDPFEADTSDIDMPELDERIEAQSENLEESAGESTEDVLQKSSDRQLLSSVDPWADTVPEPKPGKDNATPRDNDQDKPADESQLAAPKAKTLSFKAGEQALEVPETAMVPVKVDGKTVEVPVTELMANYSGKVAWDKRFSDLTNERRSFASERQKFVGTQERSQKLLQDLHKSIGSGDTFGAIASLVAVSGLEGKIDPRKYVAELRNSLFEQAQKLAELSPEERGQLEAREEYEYTKKQLEELRQAREREQSEYQAQVGFAKKLQEHSLQAEDLQKSWDYLIEDGQKHGIDPHKLGPEDLLQYTLSVREFETAIGALKSVSDDVAENRQYQDEAVRLLRAYPGTTKEQLAEIFREAIGQKRSDAVSKKVQKAPISTPASAKAKAQAKPGTSQKSDMLSRIVRKSDVWDF
jgi:hypothetical protein